MDAPRYDALCDHLRAFGSVAVAFSGGVDSALLLHAARAALGERALAITVRSPFFCAREQTAADELAARLGGRRITVAIDPLAVAQVRTNPPDRCYHCKRQLLEAVRARAAEEGIATIVEGSHRDDLDDYRPGMQAVKELGIRSPLIELDITKAEVRALARAHGLAVWDRPALACLASRVPVGELLSRERLARIDAAEETLRARGYAVVRVRDHGELARIEVAPEAIARLLAPVERAAVAAELERLGYRYVACDLGGYRRGAMNATEVAGPSAPQPSGGERDGQGGEAGDAGRAGDGDGDGEGSRGEER